MKDKIRQYANYFGLAALILWAIEPLFVSEVNALPVFELLAIIFISTFVFTAFRLTVSKRWHLVLRQPPIIWLGGFLGICLSDFAYVYASQHAPIAHVDLIDYMWPCFTIIFASLLPKERFSPQYAVATILSVFGIYLLVGRELLNNFNVEYCLGYGLALLGAMIWGSYSAFSRYYNKVPPEMIGMYCGLGFIASTCLHLQFETFVLPTPYEGGMSVLLGILMAGIAYQFWDNGVKHGNVFLLSNLTYLARVLGMALLVFFDKEPFSIALVFACVFSSLGVYLSSIETEKFHRITRYFLPSRLFKFNFSRQPA